MMKDSVFSSLLGAYEQLAEFARSENFWQDFQTAFGSRSEPSYLSWHFSL
jgi:hypothetical protein